MVISAKSIYYRSRFENSSSSKTLWAELKSIGVGKVSDRGHDLDVDLANYFGSVCQSDVDQAPIPDDLSNVLVEQQFSVREITTIDIEKVMNLSNSSATGPDGLSPAIIKIAFPVMARPLCHILNYSIEKCIFPTLWKDALICPIPKCNSPSNVSEYRPIALTCFLSKVFERIVARLTIGYLEENQRLDVYQSSYRVGMSTQTALINVLDDIKLANDKKLSTVLVLLDF